MTFEQVRNALGASDLARPNLLTNGGFEVWQRGNGPFTASALWNADTWRQYLPAGTTSVSRDTANADVAGACAAVTIASPTTNGLFQVIEVSPDAIGRTFSFSVRVKCSQANSVRCGLQSNKAATLPTTWSAYHSGGGAYETLTVTWTVAAGSNGVTVWILGSVAGTFYVDSAMLVVGAQAADYVPLHPADDLARCMRYFEASADAYLAMGQNDSATQAFFVFNYRAVKGGAPTLTLSNVATTILMRQPGGGGIAPTSLSYQQLSSYRAGLQFTCAGGLVTGQAVALNAQAGFFLTLEWNP